MARRSMVERRAAQQARHVDDLTGAPFADKLTPVHTRTVDVMSELLSMGERFTTGDTPPALRTLMGLLKRLRPTLLAQLADVPPAVIVEFMCDLRDQMTSIIDSAPAALDEPPARVDLAR